MVIYAFITVIIFLYMKIPVENKKQKKNTLVFMFLSVIILWGLNTYIIIQNPISSSIYEIVDTSNIEHYYISDVKYDNLNSTKYIPTIKAIYDINGEEIYLKDVHKFGSTAKYMPYKNNIDKNAIGEVEKNTFKYKIKDKMLRLLYFVPEYKYYTILNLEMFFNA